ncbi:hypothetical protein [Streptomyces sp. NPDC127574]|uniref:hypothetical protein n=1 Tax=Streptomyces sp. NPDC127574 TaxID=3345401 RepID=UPI003636241E
MRLEISNTGKRDVHPDDFILGDDSLVFDFKSNVIEVLDVITAPPSSPKPPTDISGSLVKIQRSPIAHGTNVFYTVLLDGPKGSVELKSVAIRDTPVRMNRPSGPVPGFRIAGMVIAAICTIYAIIIFVVVLSGNDWALLPVRVKPTDQQCRIWEKTDPVRAARECSHIVVP